MSKKSKGDAPNFESPEELARQREADAIAIPKGQSKVKTILAWSAMIFGCLAFMITGAMQSTFEGRADTGEAHLSWTGMDGESRSLNINDFFADASNHDLMCQSFNVQHMALNPKVAGRVVAPKLMQALKACGRRTRMEEAREKKRTERLTR